MLIVLPSEHLFGTIAGVEYPSTTVENQELARSLDAEICAFSAQSHASVARVARAAARFDEINGWCAPGIRSFEHWLAINAGFNLHTGGELLRVGQALGVLPRIAAAFAAGQLSFDKVRQITTVATPATDAMLLEVALGASGSQLSRICRGLRRIAEANAPDREADQQARRGLWTHWDEHGMLELVAKLPPEDAAVVLAAIESITGSKPVPDQADAAVKDPADDRWAARRLDALVAMSENVVAGGAQQLVSSAASRQVVVHVDVGVLTGESPDGRSYIEGGAWRSAEAARRIGCDAEVAPVVERDGLPIDVGRKRRIVPDRLRRALEVRDRFCRFPGCSVPAHRAQAHHHQHWADGGATTLDNTLLLCGFHHRRHHDGGYRIRKLPGGELRFETDDGHLIGPATRDPVMGLLEDDFGDAARAQWGGEHMDFDHTMFVLAHNSELAEARAAPIS